MALKSMGFGSESVRKKSKNQQEFNLNLRSITLGIHVFPQFPDVKFED